VESWWGNGVKMFKCVVNVIVPQKHLEYNSVSWEENKKKKIQKKMKIYVTV